MPTYADTLKDIGYCHIKMEKYEDALKYFNEALKIYENMSLDVDQDRNLAETHSGMGECLAALQRYDNAWSRLKRSLKIFQNITEGEEKEGVTKLLREKSGTQKAEQITEILKFLANMPRHSTATILLSAE